MKHLPTKPLFDIEVQGHWAGVLSGGRTTAAGSIGNVKAISKEEFDKWYDQVFDKAQIVYGRIDGDFGWFDHKEDVARIEKTHRALLISVEPLKKESADDLLKEIVEIYFSNQIMSTNNVLERAHAFLERKSNG